MLVHKRFPVNSRLMIDRPGPSVWMNPITERAGTARRRGRFPPGRASVSLDFVDLPLFAELRPKPPPMRRRPLPSNDEWVVQLIVCFA